MAKAVKKMPAVVAAEAINLEGLIDPITGPLILGSVEVDEETSNPVEVKVLTMAKGKDIKGTLRYIAWCNGVQSGVKGSVAAAINELLEHGLKVLPAAWAVPNNEKEIRFPEKGDNKPKEPEKFEDLSVEKQDEMKQFIADLQTGATDYLDASSRTKASVRSLAQKLRDVRGHYTKAEFGLFVKLADPSSYLAQILTAKNTLSEFVFLAGVPDELYAMMPGRVSSPKAVQTWVSGLRNTIANMVVQQVKTMDEGVTASVGVMTVLSEHVSGDITLAFEADKEATELLLRMHFANIEGTGRLFDSGKDGGFIAARGADNKGHATASLFGSEGADEMVNALCRAFNGYVSASEKAAISDMRVKTNALVKEAASFGSWDDEQVALHLFTILSSRINVDTEETLADTTEHANIVIDRMAAWIDGIRDGALTVDDILHPKQVPASESEAEAEADAA